MKKKEPYNNSISNYFLLAILIALIIGFSSCSDTYEIITPSGSTMKVYKVGVIK